MHPLADGFANSPAQWVNAVTVPVILGLVGYIARTLVKVSTQLGRLSDAVFPERKDSLPDQVEAVRDDLHMLRVQGSDRLKEILNEAKLTRVEVAQQRHRDRRGEAPGY